MLFNKLNKNLLGSIVIIISLILVFTCIAQLMFSQPESSGGEVKWNNLTFILPQDSTYAVDDNLLVINSSIKAYNMRVDKTTDLSDYDKYIASDVTSVVESPYNSTHKLLMNNEKNYAVIIGDKLIKDNPTSNPYVIKDNVELIEFKGEDSNYMSSFILSSYQE